MDITHRTRRNFAAVRKRDRGICRYCGYPGDEIDHVIPHSWKINNGLYNLVVACKTCNLLGSNFIFSSFSKKKEYILQERKKRNLRSRYVGRPRSAFYEFRQIEKEWEDLEKTIDERINQAQNLLKEINIKKLTFKLNLKKIKHKRTLIQRKH